MAVQSFYRHAYDDVVCVAQTVDFHGSSSEMKTRVILCVGFNEKPGLFSKNSGGVKYFLLQESKDLGKQTPLSDEGTKHALIHASITSDDSELPEVFSKN